MVTDDPDDDLARALELFGLAPPLTAKQLTYKRRELLHLWYPARYANLTNSPRKYMQMYKQAEEMTKQIEAAYQLLSSRFDPQ
ncbi:MAG: hypothetical protein NW703_05220 [Nitrospiraceae bacterium]